MTTLPRPSRSLLWVMAAFLLLGTVFKLVAARPTWIHYDENYYLNIGVNFIDHGGLTPYMWRLGADSNIIAGSGTGYGILLLTGWQALVGIGLYSGRVLMILVGLATALLMYRVAARWWGSPLAGAAALIVAVSSTSPFYSMVVRMDALGMLAYAAALLVHIEAVRRESRTLHALTGVAIVIAAEFHILAILLLVGLTLYYAVEYAGALIRARRIVFDHAAVWYGLGGLAAGLVYIAVHILPDPAAYFVISDNCWDCSGSSLQKELLRWQRFGVMRFLEVLVLLLAVVSAAVRRTPEDRHYLLVLGGWLLALTAVGPPPFTHYTYHIWVLVALGAAGFVARGFGGGVHPRRLALSLGGALILLASSFGFHLINVEPFELREDTVYDEAVTYTQANIPTDTVVMADVTMFYPLKDFRAFMAYRNGYEYGPGQAGIPILDYWREQAPQVFIGDRADLDDPDLNAYLDESGFVERVPDLWVSPSVAAQLTP